MFFRPAIVTFALLLSACSSEDIETANFGSDIYKNDYNLINATDYEVAFHIANTELDGDERDVENSKYHVKTLISDSDPVRITHEHNTNREISFFVQSVNKLGMLKKRKLKVSNDRDYHFIAMQDNSDAMDLKVLRREKNDHDNKFTVRVLAASDLTLKINDAVVELNEGNVSNWYQVEQCDSDIRLAEGDLPISLCNASLDRSYLLVVNESGLKKIALEY
ncbi:hypothetical protein ACSLBF_05260 [Pseudoalteromonas sp. T1lg65]|uniref:hypothetical protein n=1 Tax=Pseudoalteromonas sp. T1lg65 TaxID=2077101 RepID=UPI003F78C545